MPSPCGPAAADACWAAFLASSATRICSLGSTAPASGSAAFSGVLMGTLLHPGGGPSSGYARVVIRSNRRSLLIAGSALLLGGCVPAAPPSTTVGDAAPSGRVTPLTDGPTSATTSAATPAETAGATAPAASTTPAVASTKAAAPTASELRSRCLATYGSRTPQQWGMAMTGILSRTSSKAAVLTLDACGGGTAGNGVDQELLDFLVARQIPATLFLNQRWIEANPVAFGFIASHQQFEVGNHGTVHKPLSVNGHMAYTEHGTASVGEAFDEVMGNHEYLTRRLGAPPRFFRSGTAHYDEVAVAIVKECGEVPVGFDVNADAGTTFSAAQIQQAMKSVRSGSIVIGHMNRPARSTYEGLAAALPAAIARGVRFVKLSDAV